MDFRHECKYRLNLSDFITIRQHLRIVACPDKHTEGGVYQVRSLYFDTPEDKALRDKLDGVNRREKFRLRCYNNDPSMIRLEKKSKINNLGNKQTAILSKTEVQALIDGSYDWMQDSGMDLVQELYTKITLFGLRPKTIVDYKREPYVYAPGNVRVTLDYDIRTGLFCTDFLDPECITLPAPDAPLLMEVKFDAFLPDVIQRAVQLGRIQEAYSKYAACRMYD